VVTQQTWPVTQLLVCSVPLHISAPPGPPPSPEPESVSASPPPSSPLLEPELDPLPLLDPPNPLLLDVEPLPELEPPFPLPLEPFPEPELPFPPPEPPPPPEPLDAGPWFGVKVSGAVPLHAPTNESTPNPDQTRKVLRTASSSVSKGCDTARCKPGGIHPDAGYAVNVILYRPRGAGQERG
jgi:hypothetical protein